MDTVLYDQVFLLLFQIEYVILYHLGQDKFLLVYLSLYVLPQESRDRFRHCQYTRVC